MGHCLRLEVTKAGSGFRSCDGVSQPDAGRIRIGAPVPNKRIRIIGDIDRKIERLKTKRIGDGRQPRRKRGDEVGGRKSRNITDETR